LSNEFLYPIALLIFFSLCKRSLSDLFTKRLGDASLLEENKLNYLNISIERLFGSAVYYPALIYFSFFSLFKRYLSQLTTKRVRGALLLEKITPA